MSINLNDLRLFVEIVEHRGILRAARALGLPKSTISRRLGGLEEQLRTRLIVRSGDGFTLTAAGHDAFRVALPMVTAARAAEERLLAAGREVAGQVMISVSPALVDHAFAGIDRLAECHPQLSLGFDVSDRPIEPMGDGPDLYLRLHIQPLRDTSLIQRRICRSPQILAAAPGVTVSGPDMTGGPGLLVFSDGSEKLRTDLSGPDGARRVTAGPVRVASPDIAMLVGLAMAGRGVLLAPEATLRPMLQAGVLTRVLPEWQGQVALVTLLSPPRHAMSAALRATADGLAQAVKLSVMGVPAEGQGVPESRPPDVTDLSRSGPTRGMRRFAARPTPDPASTAGDDFTMNPMTKALGSAALAAAVGLATPALAQDASGPLVLYTNDFEGVVTDRFEADTGREIDVVQMSGGELLARIAAEAANPQWDALIFNGSYTFEMLDRQGMLKQDIAPANIGNLNALGREYLPGNGAWFPIGLAASCVMLYRTDLVDAPPQEFADLADPRFEGMFGMADPAVAAPAYPCVAALFETMGQDAAKEMFTSLFSNGMRVFRTNGPTGRALSSGEISLALITSQVAYTVLAEAEVPVAVVWPKDGAPGVVRGVGISAGTARPEAAKAFVEWLLEPATQSHLAEAIPSDGKFEPTVEGALRRADGPPEGMRYIVAGDGFAVDHEADIKSWFADQALN